MPWPTLLTPRYCAQLTVSPGRNARCHATETSDSAIFLLVTKLVYSYIFAEWDLFTIWNSKWPNWLILSMELCSKLRRRCQARKERNFQFKGCCHCHNMIWMTDGRICSYLQHASDFPPLQRAVLSGCFLVHRPPVHPPTSVIASVQCQSLQNSVIWLIQLSVVSVTKLCKKQPLKVRQELLRVSGNTANSF